MTHVCQSPSLKVIKPSSNVCCAIMSIHCIFNPHTANSAITQLSQLVLSRQWCHHLQVQTGSSSLSTTVDELKRSNILCFQLSARQKGLQNDSSLLFSVSQLFFKIPVVNKNGSKQASQMCQWEPCKAALQRDTASVFPDFKVRHNHYIWFQKKIKEVQQGSRTSADIRKSSSPELCKNRCFLTFQPGSKTQSAFPSMELSLHCIAYSERTERNECKEMLPHLLHAVNNKQN